jgi:hypothetical protein
VRVETLEAATVARALRGTMAPPVTVYWYVSAPGPDGAVTRVVRVDGSDAESVRVATLARRSPSPVAPALVTRVTVPMLAGPPVKAAMAESRMNDTRPESECVSQVTPAGCVTAQVAVKCAGS